MRTLPVGTAALVVRTDFTDDALWEQILVDILRPTEEDFRATVHAVNDPDFRGLDPAAVLARVADEDQRSFLMVVDEIAVRSPEHPVLVVDLRRERGRAFRAVPRAVQSVENNLSLANMDFAEFANAVDADGIFRGF